MRHPRSKFLFLLLICFFVFYSISFQAQESTPEPVEPTLTATATASLTATLPATPEATELVLPSDTPTSTYTATPPEVTAESTEVVSPSTAIPEVTDVVESTAEVTAETTVLPEITVEITAEVTATVAPTEAVLPSPTVALSTATPDEYLTITIPPDAIANQVVISFAANASAQEKQAYLQQMRGQTVREIPQLGAVVIQLPEQAVSHMLRHSPVLRGVQPNYRAIALTDDPLYPQQWGLEVIQAPQAWPNLPENTPELSVAVIDSGICAAHPDLQGRIVAGWDFVENDAIPQDDLGHGCAVSGVIAANMNNALGIAGVAPNAQIMPLRALNSTGSGTYATVAEAIVYAVDSGASIINLSLGGSSPSTVLEDAVNYATAQGVMLVAAAGNTGGSVLYPAAYPSVIAVAAIDPDLQMSSFSSRGAEIDLLAPGRDILTTSKDGDYALFSGTSFAAPHVTGVALLQMALGGDLTLDGGIVSVGETQPEPEVTETVEPSPTVTMTSTPDPIAPSIVGITGFAPLQERELVYENDFEATSPDLSAWQVNSSISPVAINGGQAIRLGGGLNPLVYTQDTFEGVIVSARFLMESEIMQIQVRHSEQGAYIATLHPSGLVELYRGAELLDTTSIGQVQAGAWYTFEVTAMWDMLHIRINDAIVLAYSDMEIRQAGQVIIGSGRNTNSEILIDDIKIYVRALDPVAVQSNNIVAQQYSVSVADGDVAGLITAIHNANNDPSCTASTPAEIHLAANGFYGLTTANNSSTSGDNGLPVIKCPIIIYGNFATIRRDVETASPQFRIFAVDGDNGGELTLDRVMLSNGLSLSGGGAIYVFGSSSSPNTKLNLNYITVTDNWAAGFGGAIADSSWYANIDIQNSSFTNNTAVGAAGALWFGKDDTVLINTSTFSANQARDEGGAIGVNSGITGGLITITQSLFEGNHVSDYDEFIGGGNAIWMDTGTSHDIQQNCFENNYSDLPEAITYYDVETVNVPNNWWGDASGPSTNPLDTFPETVFSNATYSPPLSTRPDCGYMPSETSEIIVNFDADSYPYSLDPGDADGAIADITATGPDGSNALEMTFLSGQASSDYELVIDLGSPKTIYEIFLSNMNPSTSYYFLIYVDGVFVGRNLGWSATFTDIWHRQDISPAYLMYNDMPLYGQEIRIEFWSANDAKVFIDDVRIITDDMARLDLVNFDADTYPYQFSNGGLTPAIFTNDGFQNSSYVKASGNGADNYFDIDVDLGSQRDIYAIDFLAGRFNESGDYRVEFYIDGVLRGDPYTSTFYNLTVWGDVDWEDSSPEALSYQFHYTNLNPLPITGQNIKVRIIQQYLELSDPMPVIDHLYIVSAPAEAEPPPTPTPDPSYNVIVVDEGSSSQALVGQGAEVIAANDPTDNGFCTLREAIQKANYLSEHADDDPPPNPATDPFPDCTPTGSDTSLEAGSFAVDLFPATYVYINPLEVLTGGEVLVRLRPEDDDGLSYATIKRSDFTPNQFRIFNIQGGALTLENIIVSNGHAVGDGGGILNAGTLTLINSSVIGNYAEGNGGGIYNTGTGTLDIQDSKIQDNVAEGQGGAIYHESSGTANVINGCIVNNWGLGNNSSVFATGTDSSLDVSGNWWGMANGPFRGELEGQGDATDGNVTYNGFETLAQTINGQACENSMIILEVELPR